MSFTEPIPFDKTKATQEILYTHAFLACQLKIFDAEQTIRRIHTHVGLPIGFNRATRVRDSGQTRG